MVGATVEPSPELTAALDFGGPVLMPGVGAQGGTVEAVRALAGDARDRVLPSISRELLGAGPDPRALRDAVASANEQFAAALRG